MSQLTPVHDKHDHDHEKHDHEGHDHKSHDHSRHDHGEVEKGHDSCCSSKAAPAVVSFTDAPASGAQLSTFRIEQMDCPTEQTLIQNKLGKLAGVQKLEFNLINRMLGVWHELPSTDPIRDAIASLGMQAEPIEEGVEATPAPVVKNHGGRWRCPASPRWPLKSSISVHSRRIGSWPLWRWFPSSAVGWVLTKKRLDRA